MENLRTLEDRATNATLLSPNLTKFYDGSLGFPEPSNNLPYVFANFVTSLDGRITLDQRGHVGGGEISLFNLPDRKLMAVLRTLAGGVLMGANTLRLEPDHIWTADYLLPDQLEFQAACNQLRGKLGLPKKMPHFFLTRSGEVLPEDGKIPRALTSDDADVCFLTTTKGAEQLRQSLPKSVKFEAVAFGEETVDLTAALEYIRHQGIKNLLCEGGPTVIGELITGHLLDEVFLTIAPHVVGDRSETNRPDRKTWVAGFHGLHQQTALADLISTKTNGIKGKHLFIRYRFVA